MLATGNSDVGTGNPLPVVSNYEYFDLVNNPSIVWVINRPDKQPDIEIFTLANGDIYERTFTYDVDGVLIARSAWVKQ